MPARRKAIIWHNNLYADVPLTLISILSLYFIPLIGYSNDVIRQELAKADSDRST